jgi:hypothetical protein
MVGQYNLYADGKRFLYLVVIMDWHSCKMVAFRLSNMQDTTFCIVM